MEARRILAGLRDTDVCALQVSGLSLVTAPWSQGMYHLEMVEELLLAAPVSPAPPPALPH